jgi:hypothetical protein
LNRRCNMWFCENYHLIWHVPSARTTSVIDGFSMIVLEWLEKHNVKWLKDMACMRRQTEHVDLLLFAKFEDFAGNIAAIAVASQNSISPNLCLSRIVIKMLNPLE